MTELQLLIRDSNGMPPVIRADYLEDAGFDLEADWLRRDSQLPKSANSECGVGAIDGNGHGYGLGDGLGFAYGYGHGYGDLGGYGFGHGNGHGYGFGHGNGHGYGHSYGSGNGRCSGRGKP